MGMMNVLMQLRKVCNHPDLFEPRSVQTPFTLDSIAVVFPGIVQGLEQRRCVTSSVSRDLTQPLWDLTGDKAFPHDHVSTQAMVPLLASTNTSSRSRNIPTRVWELYLEYQDQLQRNDAEKISRIGRLSVTRCSKSHGCSPPNVMARILLPLPSLEGSSTSTSISTLILDQEDRSNMLSDIIKRFVFCVPKATTRGPQMNGSVADQNIYGNLVVSLEELNRPAKQVSARLSSFFPDRKLVQFDSGKLQSLANVLRELKKGKHRVLIFTQMSKMLDILEAFLNLNGHTYLRLDGGTAVDRRQRLMDKFNSDEKVFCFILSTRSGGMGINLTGADTVIFYDNDW